MNSRADYILEKLGHSIRSPYATPHPQHHMGGSQWKPGSPMNPRPTKPTRPGDWRAGKTTPKIPKKLWGKQLTEQVRDEMKSRLEKKGSAYVSKADYILEKQAGLGNLIMKGGKKAVEWARKAAKKVKDTLDKPVATTHHDNLPGSHYNISQRVLREERDRLYR